MTHMRTPDIEIYPNVNLVTVTLPGGTVIAVRGDGSVQELRK